MLNPDFNEFAELRNARGVEYMVVGGFALPAPGHPRYTGDIDFWIRHTPDNVNRLLNVLGEFGSGSLGLTANHFGIDTVVQLGQPPRRIDLTTTIDGVSFESCFVRRERVELTGVPIDIIGLDDFKANKRAVGRLKDLVDLECLDPPGDGG